MAVKDKAAECRHAWRDYWIRFERYMPDAVQCIFCGLIVDRLK